MVSMYSDFDRTLYDKSAGTVLVCRYNKDSLIVTVDFESIISVVGMVPHNFPSLNDEYDWRFVVEKPGLDVANLGGRWEIISSQGDDNLDMIT